MHKKIILPIFILLSATQFSFSQAKDKVVQISTEYGDMKIKLYNETPKHRDNFIKLAESGFYDGTLFHRVINSFMIQGGDPDSKTAKEGQMLGNGGPGYTVPAEISPKLIHKKGVLAAARMGDDVNPARASSGSQFYIVQGSKYTENDIKMFEQRKQTIAFQETQNAFLSRAENKQYMDKIKECQQNNDGAGITKLLEEIKPLVEAEAAKKQKISYTQEQITAYSTLGGTPHLDGAYTVFGEIIEGLDVVDKIAAAQTNQQDRPLKDIKMTVKVLK
jgi:cyclophilin family peptidyl-prolyl cis-trans isomerase